MNSKKIWSQAIPEKQRCAGRVGGRCNYARGCQRHQNPKQLTVARDASVPFRKLDKKNDSGAATRPSGTRELTLRNPIQYQWA